MTQVQATQPSAPTTPTKDTQNLAPEPFDENLWLEDIHGDKALAWVQAQIAVTDAALITDSYRDLEARVLEVLDSDDRIAMVNKRGNWYYNFWRDADNPRGLWRRTDWASYIAGTPEWELLLDVDKLCKEEAAEWLWHGASLLRPATDPKTGIAGTYRRALLALSPDGGDAVTYREFDLECKEFVASGFILPTAKTRVSWLDEDTLYVGTDTGDGSMTESSYPAQSRIFKRGESLEEFAAKSPIFEVPLDHLSGGVVHESTPGFERDIAFDVIDFFNSRSYLRVGEEWLHLEVPDSASVSLHREWMLVRPRENWEVNGTVLAAGTLQIIALADFLSGSRAFKTIFSPTASQSLQSWSWTRDYLLLNLLQDVSSKILVVDPAKDWQASDLDDCPPLHSVDAYAVDNEDPATANDYWLIASGFLTPSSVLRGTIATSPQQTSSDAAGSAQLVREAPHFFNANDYQVQQFFAESKDGTKIPYFQVSAKDLKNDGGNPTLLSGYGGFEISHIPTYSGTVGRSWLERRVEINGVPRAGVFVVANIRGGGEYGPLWHTAALKENRHKAYEDFAAVAQDLVARGVCTTSLLGCAGGSNGGLLVGNMITTYPELFGAVSCGVPLLDMRRYTKLSAGASWIAEYGDPDVPAQWEFIRTFSPYHLLLETELPAGSRYPASFFWTATSDDRVGPVQARKMAARMQKLDHGAVWFHEALEGGHAGAGNNAQAARLHTASHEFLWRSLTGTLEQG